MTFQMYYGIFMVCIGPRYMRSIRLRKSSRSFNVNAEEARERNWNGSLIRSQILGGDCLIPALIRVPIVRSGVDCRETIVQRELQE